MPPVPTGDQARNDRAGKSNHDRTDVPKAICRQRGMFPQPSRKRGWEIPVSVVGTLSQHPVAAREAVTEPPSRSANETIIHTPSPDSPKKTIGRNTSLTNGAIRIPVRPLFRPGRIHPEHCTEHGSDHKALNTPCATAMHHVITPITPVFLPGFRITSAAGARVIRSNPEGVVAAPLCSP